MEILLDFVYTETVLVTVENVQELLPAACLLQLKGKVRAVPWFKKFLIIVSGFDIVFRSFCVLSFYNFV